jgi:hypothetical protein
MMTTHDPFQNAFAAYNPFPSPYANSPWGQQAYGGLQGYNGINPQQLQIAQQLQQLQQLQLAQLLASQAATQNPFAPHNPLTPIAFQNPLAAAALQNPLLAQLGNPLAHSFGLQQQPSLYGQAGQSGYPLAPQTMIGQNPLAGTGQGFGQIHPLVAQQLAARSLQTPGIGGW